jgi:hypothetical protein
MRTFKGVGLIVLIAVVSGLILSGCDTAKAIVPQPGQKELVINPLGKINTTGNTIQVVGSQTEIFESNEVFWYYDIPEEDCEYAAITVNAFGYSRNMYLHLHISKKPPEKQ